MMLEKHPLFLFIIKMLIAILYKQFDTYTVVQNNGDIVQSIDIYRGYRAAEYFISVFLTKYHSSLFSSVSPSQLW